MKTLTKEEAFEGINLSEILPKKYQSKKFGNGELLDIGIKFLADEFSPRKRLLNFLGFGERQSRTKDETIEFLVKNKLVNNGKIAEEFLEKIKNNPIRYSNQYLFCIIETRKNGNKHYSAFTGYGVLDKK